MPIDPYHVRRDCKSLASWLDQMGVKKIPIDANTIEAINRVAAELIKSPKPRTALAGAKLAQAALRYNLDLAETADKISRLDEGKPTENVAHQFVATFDRQG